MVDMVQQVIYNMFVTKDLGRKLFEYIYPLVEILQYIAWEIKYS